MKKSVSAILCVAFAICVIGLAGCGKSVDENEPVSDIKADAEKMDVAQLKDIAVKYKDALMAKKADVDKVMAKLKDIPIAKMVGKEASEFKSEIDTLSKSVKALKERFDIYYNKLKEKGGDVSGLQL